MIHTAAEFYIIMWTRIYIELEMCEGGTTNKILFLHRQGNIRQKFKGASVNVFVV